MTQVLTRTDEDTLAHARQRLVDEWHASDPHTPEQITAFYRDNQAQAAELDAWHRSRERRDWTEVVTHVAQEIGAKSAVDIGCGRGHDLCALRALGLSDLVGVEPNERMADDLHHDGFPVVDLASAPIERADLLVCIDVLEHVSDPGAFLADIAKRAKPNAVLVESTATDDCTTPLHLATNRGWHPGNTLETHGWELLDARDRLRVWQRMRPHVLPRASALLCAYRACSIPTMASLLKLQQAGWRLMPKWGDGYIPRVRGIITSTWYRETADDVFLMIDDDIVFEPAMAERLVAMCRDGHDIICAAYPVRDGGHLAIAGLGTEFDFGPDQAPVEIRYAATGFMAVHRRVIEGLVKTLPLCHANQPWAYWPMYGGMVVPEADPIGHVDLSEDWAFCERVRALGFKVWLDPTIKLDHLATVPISVNNMAAIHRALGGVVDHSEVFGG